MQPARPIPEDDVAAAERLAVQPGGEVDRTVAETMAVVDLIGVVGELPDVPLGEGIGREHDLVARNETVAALRLRIGGGPRQIGAVDLAHPFGRLRLAGITRSGPASRRSQIWTLHDPVPGRSVDVEVEAPVRVVLVRAADASGGDRRESEHGLDPPVEVETPAHRVP